MFTNTRGLVFVFVAPSETRSRKTQVNKFTVINACSKRFATKLFMGMNNRVSPQLLSNYY